MDIIFPKDFIFGAASSSFQIEGALKEDGRGELLWDQIFKMGDFGADPNIACDHYHRYKEDVQLMKEIGLQSYRFSISWTRILPQGMGEINQKGINFYNNLINELIKNNIEPLATLSHFDMPFVLYQKGGWGNEDSVKAFKDYSKICFENFGDRVNLWATFNEPWVELFMIPFEMQQPNYEKSKELFAKSLNHLHNLFKAHAEAISTYRELKLTGKIGIVLNLGPAYPLTDSNEDKKAAKRFDDFLNNWHLNLILKGEYPKSQLNFYKESVGAPIIKKEDEKLLKNNKSDYLGVNFYGPFIIEAARQRFPLEYKSYREKPSREWANNGKVDPKALYEILMRIHKNFDSPIIYITENGCSFGDEQVNDVKDEWRIEFIKGHLREIKKAIDDGIKVERYYFWSLMDNLEWVMGYKERYGLIYIDREHNLKRIIKKSGKWYSQIIKERKMKI